ncbi:MAG: SURF1 family protein [Alphaproteobacteria bacterium]|nr:SURF1 family protein [Alphaproteobacteria bacterium]
MFFRPLPALTIASVLAFVLLVGLGAWQLERLHWKLDLIARADANLHAEPLSLETRTPDHVAANEYRRVAGEGIFDNAKEAYVFGTDEAGDAVYHVVVPFRLGDGRVFLVDRGVVPKEKLDPATRRAGQPGGVSRVTGVWRTPDPPGTFTPKPDPKQRIWYARDLGGIARADGVTLAAPVIVEADATPNPGGWPKGGQTVVNFRNDHLQYAITWFGLAAVLAGVYIAYHVSAGRLGFR